MLPISRPSSLADRRSAQTTPELRVRLRDMIAICAVMIAPCVIVEGMKNVTMMYDISTTQLTGTCFKSFLRHRGSSRSTAQCRGVRPKGACWYTMPYHTIPYHTCKIGYSPVSTLLKQIGKGLVQAVEYNPVQTSPAILIAPIDVCSVLKQ